MAFTGSWNTALDEGDRAARHEREEVERDEFPRYELVFSYRGNAVSPFIRARLERDGAMICSGSGATEAAAVRALRSNLRELRARRAQHRPMGAWMYDFESEVAS